MTQICSVRPPPCFPCPDDEPVLNLSAEAPDNFIFVGVHDYPQDPVIGDTYSSMGCKRWCYSSVSQADASSCAQAQASECALTNNGGGGPSTPDDPSCVGLCTDPNNPIGGPFRNTPQSAFCATNDLTNVSAVLPPNVTLTTSALTVGTGVFSGFTQAEADTNALTYITNLYNSLITSENITCGLVWTYGGTVSTAASQSTAVVANGSNLPAAHSQGALDLHLDVDPIEHNAAAGCGTVATKAGQYNAYRLFGPYSRDAIVSITISAIVNRHPTAPCGGAPTPGFATVHVCSHLYPDTYQCGCDPDGPVSGTPFTAYYIGPCAPDPAGPCSPGPCGPPNVGINCQDYNCYFPLADYTGDFDLRVDLNTGTSDSKSQIIGGRIPAGKIGLVRCGIQQLGINFPGTVVNPQAKCDLSITVTLL